MLILPSLDATDPGRLPTALELSLFASNVVMAILAFYPEDIPHGLKACAAMLREDEIVALNSHGTSLPRLDRAHTVDLNDPVAIQIRHNALIKGHTEISEMLESKVDNSQISGMNASLLQNDRLQRREIFNPFQEEKIDGGGDVAAGQPLTLYKSRGESDVRGARIGWYLSGSESISTLGSIESNSSRKGSVSDDRTIVRGVGRHYDENKGENRRIVKDHLHAGWLTRINSDDKSGSIRWYVLIKNKLLVFRTPSSWKRWKRGLGSGVISIVALKPSFTVKVCHKQVTKSGSGLANESVGFLELKDRDSEYLDHFYPENENELMQWCEAIDEGIEHSKVK
eukprot:g240.t1